MLRPAPIFIVIALTLVIFSFRSQAETLHGGTHASTLQVGIKQKVIQAQVSEQAEEPQIVFLFDNSGSMQTNIPSGGSRLDAARSALNAAVSDTDARGWMGLRIFGTSDAKDCGSDDSELLVAPSADSRQKIAAQSNRIKGIASITQFGRALKISLEKDFDFKSNRRKKLVLLTDGEDSCMPLPQICQIAKEAKQRISNLQIDVIAYSIQDAQVRKGLRCLANSTGGQFFEADDVDQIRNSFLKTTRRVQGTVMGQDSIVAPIIDSSESPAHGNGNEEMSW